MKLLFLSLLILVSTRLPYVKEDVTNLDIDPVPFKTSKGVPFHHAINRSSSEEYNISIYEEATFRPGKRLGMSLLKMTKNGLNGVTPVRVYNEINGSIFLGFDRYPFNLESYLRTSSVEVQQENNESIALSLFEAVSEIHQFNVLHSDLKETNVYIANDFSVHIGNFEESKEINLTKSAFVSELNLKTDLEQKVLVEIRQLAKMIYRILTGRNWMQDLADQKLPYGDLNAIEWRYVSEETDIDWQMIVLRMLTADKEEQLTPFGYYELLIEPKKSKARTQGRNRNFLSY